MSLPAKEPSTRSNNVQPHSPVPVGCHAGSRGRRPDTALVKPRRGLAAGGEAQFVEQVGDVALDGVRAEINSGLCSAGLDQQLPTTGTYTLNISDAGADEAGSYQTHLPLGPRALVY